VDLSVAVATPKGLVTPVIRNAESLSFVEFERELTALGKKAWVAHFQALYAKFTCFFLISCSIGEG